MNDCFFDFLPASFGRMTQLQVLELRDNQLQILPKSIRRLTLLSRLDIGGNVFQEWVNTNLKLVYEICTRSPAHVVLALLSVANNHYVGS